VARRARAATMVSIHAPVSRLALLGAWFCGAGALTLSPGGSKSDVNATETTTLLFVAGLEGTGHNFFDRALNEMQAVRFSFLDNWNAYGMIRTNKSWSEDNLEENAKHLADRVSMYPGQVMYVAATLSSSWPSGQGSSYERRNNRQPSISLLRRAAARAGEIAGRSINVQILVTQRSPEETIVATCMHRHDLGSCPEQAETLAVNAGLLAEQLYNTETKAFHCVRYGDLPSLASGLAAALTDEREPLSKAEAAIQGAWMESNVGAHEHHDPKADDKEVKDWAEQMRAPLRAIDVMCKGSHEAAGSPDMHAPPAEPGARRPTPRPSPYIQQLLRGILPPTALQRAERRASAP